jgi:hypothetical protein
MSENVAASISRNPKGLQCVYEDNFTFFREVDPEITRSRITVLSRTEIFALKKAEVRFCEAILRLNKNLKKC